MDFLKKLEKKIMEVNESLPKLPEGLVVFLGDWAWLFTALSVVLGVLAIFAIFSILFIGSLTMYGLGIGIYILTLLAIIIFGFAGNLLTIYLNIKSIKPLKAKLYKGWQLMLLAGVLNFIFGALQNLIEGGISSLLKSAALYALSLYFMAQVRDQFILGEELRELGDITRA